MAGLTPDESAVLPRTETSNRSTKKMADESTTNRLSIKKINSEIHVNYFFRSSDLAVR